MLFIIDENNQDNYPLMTPISIIEPTPTPSTSPTPTPELEFPTTIVLASVAIIVVVGIGLLVYFKKYKNWRLES